MKTLTTLTKVLTTSAVALTLSCIPQSALAWDDSEYNLKGIHLNQDKDLACARLQELINSPYFEKGEKLCGTLSNRVMYENNKVKSIFLDASTFGLDTLTPVEDLAQMTVDYIPWVDELEWDFIGDVLVYSKLNTADQVKIRVLDMGIGSAIEITKLKTEDKVNMFK